LKIRKQNLIDPSQGYGIPSRFDLRNQVNKIETLNCLVERFGRVFRNAAADTSNFSQLCRPIGIGFSRGHFSRQFAVTPGKRNDGEAAAKNRFIKDALFIFSVFRRETCQLLLSIVHDATQSLGKNPFVVHAKMTYTVCYLQHHGENVLIHICQNIFRH